MLTVRAVLGFYSSCVWAVQRFPQGIGREEGEGGAEPGKGLAEAGG